MCFSFSGVEEGDEAANEREEAEGEEEKQDEEEEEEESSDEDSSSSQESGAEDEGADDEGPEDEEDELDEGDAAAAMPLSKEQQEAEEEELGKVCLFVCLFLGFVHPFSYKLVSNNRTCP